MERLQRRTLAFGVAILTFCRRLEPSPEAGAVRRQLVRSGTGIGANYRAVCRARSRKEFIARLGIAVEECDETLYWLDLLRDAGIGDPEHLNQLRSEADQILRILGTASATARGRAKSSNPRSSNHPIAD